MCGIIGVFNTEKEKIQVNDEALEIFEDQAERGTKGFGIINIDGDNSYLVDRATEPYKFLWDIHAKPTNRIIIHHRQPTSTDNKIHQTHPILVSSGSLAHDYLVIHNGIITNDDELRKMHEGLGFIYNTVGESKLGYERFNDSECLAIEMARYIEKQTKKLGIRGSAAFIAIQIDKKTKKVEQMFFGRTSSAVLNMAKTRNKLILSSEGKGDEIKEETLYSCKMDDNMELKKSKLEIEPYEEEKPTRETVESIIHKHKVEDGMYKEEEEERQKYLPLGSDDPSQTDIQIGGCDEGDLDELEEIAQDTLEQIQLVIDDFVTEMSMVDPGGADLEHYVSQIRANMRFLQEKAIEIKTVEASPRVAPPYQTEEKEPLGF